MLENENELSNFIPGEKEVVVMEAIQTKASGMGLPKGTRLNFS
jgi:hypothetical protein